MSLPLAALRPCGPLSGVLQTLAAAQQSKLRIIQTNSAGDNIHIIGAATNKVRLTDRDRLATGSRSRIPTARP
jgi:hypothetical protein